MRGGTLGLVLVLILQMLPPVAAATPGAMAPAATPHGPIIIEGDSGFTPASGVSAGSGTAVDPFLIEGWSIAITGGLGIQISNTTASFRIVNVSVQTNGPTGQAVQFTNISNAQVQNLTIGDPYVGVRVDRSRNVTFEDNRVDAVSLALIFVNCSRIVVQDDLEGGGITVQGSTDVWLRDNQLVGYFGYGIFIDRSQRVNLSGNGVRRVMNEGIRVARSESVDVYRNVLIEDGSGIELASSNRINVTGNVAWGNGLGISIDETTNVTMRANYLEERDSVLLEGRTLSQFATHVIGEDNTINGRAIVYRKNCAPGTILDFSAESVGEAIVVNCPDVHVSGLFLANTQVGLVMAYVDGGEVTRNRFVRIDHGGADLTHSSHVVLHRNVFVDTRGSDDGSTNRWNGAYPSGGNWWSEYSGRDECAGPEQDVCPNPDGIGDFPYLVDPWSETVQDRYPLMAPLNWTGAAPAAFLNVTSVSNLPWGTVGLDANGSYDPEGGPLQVRWDWQGDGVWDTWWSSDLVIQHAFANPGTYTVWIAVRDRDGFWSVSSAVVTIGPPPPPPYELLLVLIVVSAVVVAYVAWWSRQRRQALSKTFPPPPSPPPKP